MHIIKYIITWTTSLVVSALICNGCVNLYNFHGVLLGTSVLVISTQRQILENQSTYMEYNVNVTPSLWLYIYFITASFSSSRSFCLCWILCWNFLFLSSKTTLWDSTAYLSSRSFSLCWNFLCRSFKLIWRDLTDLHFLRVQTSDSTFSGPAWSLVFFSCSTTSARMVFLFKAGLGVKVCLHWGQL